MKNKFLLMLTALLLLAVPVWAQDGSKGTITSSEHDFSATAGELCGVCHIPHQNSGSNRVLLWNHATTTAAAYSAYSSATLNATVTALDPSSATQQLGNEFYSLACMSCHDGATANNVVYRVPDGLTGTAAGSFFSIGTATTLGAANNLGTDLNNDHPVNFAYTTALATADRGLYDPAGGTTLNTTLKSVRTATYGTTGQLTQPVLYNDTVQCATCHNPHNNTTAPFLRVANTGSALCLKCHSTT